MCVKDNKKNQNPNGYFFSVFKRLQYLISYTSKFATVCFFSINFAVFQIKCMSSIIFLLLQRAPLSATTAIKPAVYRTKNNGRKQPVATWLIKRKKTFAKRKCTKVRYLFYMIFTYLYVDSNLISWKISTRNISIILFLFNILNYFN